MPSFLWMDQKNKGIIRNWLRFNCDHKKNCNGPLQLTGFGALPQQAFRLCIYEGPACRSLWLKDAWWNLLKNFLFFVLYKMGKQCSWLSIATNRLLGLPQTPVYAESILRLRVQRTLFIHHRIFKITWFRKESGDFLFNEKAHHLICRLSHRIQF